MAKLNSGTRIYGNVTVDTFVTATGNVTGGNVLTGGIVSATGNISGGNLNVTGNIVDTGPLSIITNSNGNIDLSPNGTGNVNTGANLSVTGRVTAASVTGGVITGTSVSVSGGVTAASVAGGVITGTSTSVTGTQTAASTVGGVITGSSVSVTGAVSGASVVGGVMTGTSLSTSGNVTGGNISTVGQVSATGNVTTDTFFVGNGYFLTGIESAVSVTKIENGNSNVWVNTPGGDVTVTAGGVSNVAVFSTGSLTLQGTLGTPKTITANIAVAPDINAILIGPVVFGNGYNLSVPDSSTVYTYTDGTNDIVGTTVTVSGAITAASVSVSGGVTAASVASGVITGSSVFGEVITGTTVSVSGNITAGNIETGGTISITGASTAASYSATGNITGSNLSVGSGTIIGGNLSAGTGTVTVGNIVNGGGNGVGNIGNSSTYFNTVFATATRAQYADLAENYEADAVYEPGTVLCFGGSKEVTVCNLENCTRVAGVVSTNPSYLMNAGQTGDHVVAVALQGRVPTKVTGQVRKGDMMVSAGNGQARANNEARAGTIIGKALADSEGNVMIQVVVGRD